MFFGFAVKVPVAPLHTWLPDAHVEAPTPVSVMLAGVLLKMGTYALLRFNFTMLPETARARVPLALSPSQRHLRRDARAGPADLKRIVAYSSISSMGYVILGLIAYTPYGVGGATFQMVAHGLISGLMFMAVGVIYNTTHTRMVGDMSGIADRMPGRSASSSPPPSGTWACRSWPASRRVLHLQGLVQRSTLGGAAPVLTSPAMFGIVIVAGYLLWAMQRTLFGGSIWTQTTRSARPRSTMSHRWPCRSCGHRLGVAPASPLYVPRLDFTEVLESGVGAGLHPAGIGSIAPGLVSLALALAGAGLAYRLYEHGTAGRYLGARLPAFRRVRRVVHHRRDGWQTTLASRCSTASPSSTRWP